jgi:hypothetical protein
MYFFNVNNYLPGLYLTVSRRIYDMKIIQDVRRAKEKWKNHVLKVLFE